MSRLRGNPTNIEWVKSPDGSKGMSWNPITGCLNHDNGLCKGGGFPCYAYRLAHGRLKQRYLGNEVIANEYGSFLGITAKLNDPFYPRFWPERLREDLGARPRGVFVCDMSDLFGIGVPDDWTQAVLHKFTAVNYSDHRFYLLTKQPQNLIKWSPFPTNCYVGVSVTRNNQLENALKYLKEIEATVKFISFEPLLEKIELDL